MAGHPHQKRGQRLGQSVREFRTIGDVDFGDAVQLGRGCRGVAYSLAGHQDVDLAQQLGRGHGAAGGLLDLAVLVVEQH